MVRFDPNKITLNYFTFPEHTKPSGCLSKDRRSQACWYFYLLAQKQKEIVGESVDDQFAIIEGNPWKDKHYVQTARTVAKMYGLESPSEFMKAWDEVIAEAQRSGLPIPSSEITNAVPRIFLPN